MQAVVGNEDRPFDRDLEGKPITRRWDILACGHALPSRRVVGAPKRIMRANAGGDYYENYETRKCKVCDV